MPKQIENRRVLVIDDDYVSSVALAQRLEKRGFSVSVLPSTENALSLIESQSIECVLLDMVMPKVDGFSFLTELRKKYSKNQLVVMMVTVVKDSVDMVKVFEAGANDYLIKPVNLDVAVARIHAHLSTIDLHVEIMKSKEIEAIRAMVTTCCHEINNPLTIAIGALSLLEKKSVKIDQDSYDKLVKALDRIKGVSSKIREVIEHKELTFEQHNKKIKSVILNNKK